MRNKQMNFLSVIFENVDILRAAVLSKTEPTKLFIVITSTGGEFEICEGEDAVCTGRIYCPEETKPTESIKNSDKKLELNHNDIYKELKLRGYDYGSTFQGVIASDLAGEKGLLKWEGDWIVFLDSMLQFSKLASSERALHLPYRIQKIIIDTDTHEKVVEESLKEFNGVPVAHDKYIRNVISGGVEFRNIKSRFEPKQRSKQVPVIEEYHFVSYDEASVLSQSNKETLERYIHVCSSVAKKILDRFGKNNDQIAAVMKDFVEMDDSLVSSYLKSLTDNEVLLKYLSDILNSAFTDLTKFVRNRIDSYLSERDFDILSQTLHGERPLRTLLDIVLENTTSRMLKIAEAAEGPVTITSKLAELFRTVGSCQVEFTVAHSKPDLVKKGSLPSENCEVVPMSHKVPFAFKDIDCFVLNYLSCDKHELKLILDNAISVLRDNGFIAVLLRTNITPAERFLSEFGETIFSIHSESDFEQMCTEENLEIISKKADSLVSTLYLLRKIPDICYKDTVIPVLEEKYEKWVDDLKTEMIRAQASSEPERLWLISENSANSGIIGLVNCLRKEKGGSIIRCIFTCEGAKLPSFSLDNQLYHNILKKDLNMNVFKKGSWGSYRYVKMIEDNSKKETSHAYLNVTSWGDLSSLVWVKAPMKYLTDPKKSVLCHVYFAPINSRDVMLANRKLPPDVIPGNLVLQDSILGLEFSGRLENGKRVMGLVPAKALATTVAADPDLVWQVPYEWSLKDASTVPVAYTTAYYALIVRGSLKKTDKVLIHSGSGGVGQAAITIALNMGCEIFTSVGSSEKKEYLKKRFPSLQDKHFCNSNDTSFEDDILDITDGKGVDVILNSLAEEKMKATLNCLAQHGRFLEIGKHDLSNNSTLGMAIFLKNISFNGIVLDTLFENKPRSEVVRKEVVQLIKDGIAKKTVKPLNYILYNHDEAEQAFRLMASGKHIGKVVLKIREEESKKDVIPTPVKMSSLLRTTCNFQKSFIIVGGLGGFGLELSQWLIDRGAHNIILTSRSGIRSGYQKICLQRWEKDGVNLVLSTLNVAKIDEAKELLMVAETHGPVGGIFNLASVLRDACLENQTVDNFREVGESKFKSTQNLDSLSRQLCSELEWFVCFSSVCCGRGIAGQSNSAYANSTMERICEERQQKGLPGLAIQWGAIGDVGVIQETNGSDVEIGGTAPQRIQSCLSVLDKFLQQSHPVVSSFVPYQI